MKEEDLNDIIHDTIETVQPIVRQPKMTPKLLGKPPFRFLVDIISEVTRNTGFGKGLFTEEELLAAPLMDKEAKSKYFEKINAYVCAATKSQVPLIKPAEAMARAAADKSVDREAALYAVMGKEWEAAAAAKAAAKAAAEAQAAAKAAAQAAAKAAAEAAAKDAAETEAKAAAEAAAKAKAAAQAQKEAEEAEAAERAAAKAEEAARKARQAGDIAAEALARDAEEAQRLADTERAEAVAAQQQAL